MTSSDEVAAPAEARLGFDQVADEYHEIRPSYPAALFDALFELVPPAPAIVEVGAGTGQATSDLLARGAVVDAVEPGPSTAAKLREVLPSARLRVHVGDFETVDLPASTFDAVFAASSYHWVSPPAQTDRPAALLRPGGVVAIVALVQVTSAADQGFFDAAQPIYQRHGEGHRGPPAPTRDEVDPPMRAVLDADDRFGDVALRRWDWDQTYTAAEYRTLMSTYSGTRMMPPERRRALLDDIETFVEEHFDGRVTRPLVVALTTAVLR